MNFPIVLSASNHRNLCCILILMKWLSHVDNADGFSIPKIAIRKLSVPQSRVTIPVGTGCAYVAYSAFTKIRIQKRFLAMEILAHVTAVDSTKMASEFLPDLIHRMKPLKSIKRLKQLEKKVDDVEFEQLWAGYLLYKCALCARAKEGWYTTGVLNERKASIYIRVTNEGQKASVHIPKTDTPKPSVLFATKKPCAIVEDPDEKLGWQQYLQTALSKREDCVTSEPNGTTNTPLPQRKIQPGTYRLMYREYVTQEEIWTMMTSRHAFSPMRPTQDSTLVFHPDGHCYLEDHGCLFGIIPTKTHNEREWSATKIEWKNSSLQIGWKIACKKMEVKSVTDILLAAPWELQLDNDLVGQGNALLVHRPDKGWLVWSRQQGD